MGGSGRGNIGLGMARHGNQGEPGRKGMEKALEQRLREVFGDFPPEVSMRLSPLSNFCLSIVRVREQRDRKLSFLKAEHARMLYVLDAVVALSSATGPAVSNRDHDRYLYGKD